MTGRSLTVVVPVRNGAGTIERCLASVLAQPIDGLQVIVVDDGSDDATVAVVEAITDRRLELLRNADCLGPSGARNFGLARASEASVAFVDSDDALDPQWHLLVEHQRETGAALVTCGFRMLDWQGEWRYDHHSEPMGAAFYDLVGPFQSGTFIVDTAVLRACEGYDPSLRYSENTDLALRLSAWCCEHSLVTASLDRALMHWYHDIRHDYQAQLRQATIEQLLSRHRAQLARDPQMLASYHAQLGVWRARAGELGGARRQFAAAWRTRRHDLRHVGRWSATWSRTLSRRLWPARPAPRT